MRRQTEEAADGGGRAGALALVGAAYVAAIGAAVALGLAIDQLHPIWIALLADLLATAVVFGFSVVFDNSSFYDPYWSLVPIAIALFWAFWPAGPVGAPLRVALVLGLIGLWGLRLTWNWIRGWSGLDHEDWRYVDIRRKTGRWYWPASFAGIHLFPTLMVFGSMISAWPALTTPRPVGWLDGLAAAVTLGAILVELTADRQLRRFRRSQPPPEAVLEHGLWRWSRHPNYFGEIAFWWGLYLFALAADPGWWPAVAGPLAMTLMFVFISLPMIDRRMQARRPGYGERLRRVSAIVPWPPRA